MLLVKSGKQFNTSGFVKAVVIWVTSLFMASAVANELKGVDFNVLPGDKIELRLTMAQPPATPQEFTTENPARIALDFADTTVALEQKSMSIGVGAARSVTAVEAQGRTRVVISLVESVPFSTGYDGNDFVVVIGESKALPNSAPPPSAAVTASASASAATSSSKGIQGIDFRRGEEGEGRIMIALNNPSVGIDLRQEGRDIIADFVGVDIDDKLIRKLDVIDFATPAKFIETRRVGSNVRIKIKPSDAQFEFLAYQTDQLYTIELKPLTPEEIERKRLAKPEYTGERMSLTFQDIGVRAVLKLISEVANLNMVTTDTVAGSITLRLQNVPWDQALDIILKTKGLDKRQNGNVLLVAPADEIAAREALELQAQQQEEQLAPLISEFIQVNYAKASPLSDLIPGDKTSFLSDRGTVTVDERTNNLLIRDTATKVDEIRQLVRALDIPVRQVLIEARVVVADDGVGHEIGVRFGINDRSGNDTFSGTLAAARQYQGLETAEDIAYSELYNVPLPITNPAGSIGFTIGSLSSQTILDVELSALEAESKSEVIASPKVVTANQKEAYIEAGEEIPYEQASSAGNTNVVFKKAVLSLKVTPQITPDDRIILDLLVNQDTRGENTDSGPAINTREVGTQVLVNNGETVVLGGIYQQRKNKDITKVPVLGDIPGIGFLFRRTVESEAKSELLIFVTPKIIKEAVR